MGGKEISSRRMERLGDVVFFLPISERPILPEFTADIKNFQELINFLSENKFLASMLSDLVVTFKEVAGTKNASTISGEDIKKIIPVQTCIDLLAGKYIKLSNSSATIPEKSIPFFQFTRLLQHLFY